MKRKKKAEHKPIQVDNVCVTFDGGGCAYRFKGRIVKAPTEELNIYEQPIEIEFGDKGRLIGKAWLDECDLVSRVISGRFVNNTEFIETKKTKAKLKGKGE